MYDDAQESGATRSGGPDESQGEDCPRAVRGRGSLRGIGQRPVAVAVPLPSADPFYAVPVGISGLPNGTILA